MKKLFLENLTFFNGKEFKKISIIIEGEKIKKIMNYDKRIKISIPSINFNGLFVIPGLIDPHTHFNLKINNHIKSEGFFTGTKKAITGGITTFIDFTDGLTPFSKDIKIKLKDCKKSLCDYTFHAVFKNMDRKEIENRLNEIKNFGIKSIKIFTTYKERNLKMDDENLHYILKNAYKKDIVVCIHAEDDEIIKRNALKYRKNMNDIRYHPRIRNEESENNAILKILEINRKYGAKLYFVHISSFRSLEYINEYKIKGYKVYAETCPQYIVFNDSIYQRKDNFLYTFTPPVRDLKNQEKLIENLKYFDTIGTDSCGFSYQLKFKYKNMLSKIPMGISSNRFLLPIIYTYGVKSKKITFSDMIRLLSKEAAQIFSLKYKGEIKEGYLADLCIFDPNENFVINCEQVKNNLYYPPYYGLKLYGSVKYVFIRGRIVYKNGSFSHLIKGKYLNL